MCILFLAVQQHPRYPLIVAANRDEFYARPTRSSQYWQEYPHILAGKDKQAGGTWMGITSSGHLSALTNIRSPDTFRDNEKSRGELVSNFLINTPSNHDYAAQLQQSASAYNGYNLVFGHWQNLLCYNNQQNQLQTIEAGFHGLSNADLNSDWPKIQRGVAALQAQVTAMQATETLNSDALFTLLQNPTKADKAALPQTGVSEEVEFNLSSIFIHLPNYGTRSSTLFYVDEQHQAVWHERVYNEQAQCVANIRHELDLSTTVRNT